jgi:hypothetical protein
MAGMITPLPIIDTIPPPQTVRDRLAHALREVELLRGLLRLAARAEDYREIDRHLLLSPRPPARARGVSPATWRRDGQGEGAPDAD